MKLKKYSITESNFNIGSTKYTDKNMTPTDILSLAYEYVQLPIGKIVGNKQDTRVNSFIDLQNLTGLKYDYVKKSIIKSSKPALIVHLLKNKLVTNDEYIKLYKDLVDRTKKVGKYVSNSDSATRNTKEDDLASKYARRDMRGEFDFGENIDDFKSNAQYQIINRDMEDMDGIKESKLYTPNQVRSAVEKVKKQLINKWKTKGAYENFGDKEVRKLKDMFNVNPYGTPDERKIADIIQNFDNWAMNYTGQNESVNEAAEEPKVIQDLRLIVKHKQNNKVNDPISGNQVRVDLFTASAIVQVYDAINDTNKKKYVTTSISKMAAMAFKLMK